MVDLGVLLGTGGFGTTCEIGNGDVRNEDGGTAGWLTADVLGDVANSQVDGICRLVTAEYGKLCLVGSEYDGRDGGTVDNLVDLRLEEIGSAQYYCT